MDHHQISAHSQHEKLQIRPTAARKTVVVRRAGASLSRHPAKFSHREKTYPCAQQWGAPADAATRLSVLSARADRDRRPDAPIAAIIRAGLSVPDARRMERPRDRARRRKHWVEQVCRPHERLDA